MTYHYIFLQLMFKQIEHNKLVIKKGIRKMELRIQPVEIPQEITFNFEELKKELTEKCEFYKNMVYSDDEIKNAKEDRAKLNKLQDALDTKRKDIKKECLAPYATFEAKMKEIIELVNEPINLIGTQVKAYEDKAKNDKKKEIKFLFENINDIRWLDLDSVFDAKWLNLSVTMKKIESELAAKLTKISADIETLESLAECSFEAIDHYKKHLDLNDAIAEGRRAVGIQKRKAAAASISVGMTDEMPHTPVDYMPAKSQPKEWVNYSVLVTDKEAKQLRAFLNTMSIEFKQV